MAPPLAGGCLCGAVRYECTAEAVISGLCHCRDCQKTTGSGNMAVLAVPRAALRATGELRYFDTQAESGATSSRGFCPICGSTVLSSTTSFPELIVIAAGTLDEVERFAPTMHIFTRSAATWDAMDPRLPGFATLPDPQEMAG